MNGFLIAAIGCPLLASVALPAASRWWTGSTRRDKVLGAVPLVAVVLTVSGLVALLPWAGSDLTLSVHWLPGAGRMAIGLGATGLYAALATTGACAVALWATGTGRTHWTGALTLFSLAGAQVAFLAEHFLARYVALEIVALCVALAPLVELRSAGDPAAEHTSTDGGQAGSRLARLVYLVLRLGDVGLLVAILALWSATGTLDIAPALQAGEALAETPLSWVVAGFVLAVWVKVGGWPVHFWQQAGERLSLFAHSWLLATLMPNLGLYLLYRVTPLLAQAGSVRGATYWIGAVGAALAALLALVLMRRSARSSLVYLGAAMGGLALVWAASGLKTVVWMTALVLTPLRLLFYLAGDAAAARDPVSRPGAAVRASIVGLYALGGLALSGYCLLCAWWARQAGTPPAVLLVAEFAAAAIGIWAVRSTWLLWRAFSAPTFAARDVPSQHQMARHLPEGQASARQALALALLGGIALAGMLFLGPLAGHLAYVAHGKPLYLPAGPDVARYLAATPGFWIALVLAAAGRRFFLHRPGVATDARTFAATGSEASRRQALNLEEGLAQAAQILSAVVEVGIQERILGGIVRAVLGGARITQRVVERQILDGGIERVSAAAIGGGSLAYRVLEQEGLEGLLRSTVRGVRAGGRWMQRWHTGRLRRNLLWVAASLLLALLALALYGW